jgi:hypothetical protein
MILWDRKDDSFEDGPRLKEKIYEERCDISPDGKHFLYFALNGHWRAPDKGSYTAISKVPDFKPILLYPEGDNYGGGGYFLSSQNFVVRTDANNQSIVNVRSDLERIYLVPLKNLERLQCKPTDKFGLVDALGKTFHVDPIFAGSLQTGLPKLVLDDYEAIGPCLYRCGVSGKTLIRDFKDMTFEAPLETEEAGKYRGNP